MLYLYVHIANGLKVLNLKRASATESVYHFETIANLNNLLHYWLANISAILRYSEGLEMLSRAYIFNVYVLPAFRSLLQGVKNLFCYFL